MAVQRGEIYFVNLNPVQGRELAASCAVLAAAFGHARHTAVSIASGWKRS